MAKNPFLWKGPKTPQGDAAFCLGIRFAMSPKMIYDWGQKHGHDLRTFLKLDPMKQDGSLFIGCVLADNPYEGMLFARKAPWVDRKRGYINQV